jgi:hypothetical protein
MLKEKRLLKKNLVITRLNYSIADLSKSGKLNLFRMGAIPHLA